MMRTLLVAVFSLLFITPVFADTYSCNAVDDKAKLGYDGDLKVSIVGRNRICSFAIGGASVDSLVSQMNRDYENSLRYFDHDGDVFFGDNFQDLIRHVVELHGERANFVNPILEGSGIHLQDCHDSGSVDVNGLHVNCSFVGSNANGSEPPFVYENRWLTVEMSRPRLVISIETDRGDAALYLFIAMP